MDEYTSIIDLYEDNASSGHTGQAEFRSEIAQEFIAKFSPIYFNKTGLVNKRAVTFHPKSQ